LSSVGQRITAVENGPVPTDVGLVHEQGERDPRHASKTNSIWNHWSRALPVELLPIVVDSIFCRRLLRFLDRQW